MTLIWGMDEAGYGPNLGPLVIALTCWEIPDSAPQDFDFWRQLEKVIDRTGTRGHTRLHVADSKQVHRPALGLGPLELSALALLKAGGHIADSFASLSTLGFESRDSIPKRLRQAVTRLTPVALPPLVLPLAADADLVERFSRQLREVLHEAGILCRGIWADVIYPGTFNRELSVSGNKAELLTRRSLSLLRRHWSCRAEAEHVVYADRHGGRKFYAGALQSLLATEDCVRTLSESPSLSRYQLGRTVLEFAERSERLFPVAAASLVAKYLRELAMHEFNTAWTCLRPGLKPTKGYPEDARRFLAEVHSLSEQLEIPRDLLWREK